MPGATNYNVAGRTVNLRPMLYWPHDSMGPEPNFIANRAYIQATRLIARLAGLQHHA